MDKNTASTIIPFNPLDKNNLGESVAAAMLGRPVDSLPPAQIFNGAGIYAIYYTGNNPLYERVAKKNRNEKFGKPIYVGKAVPPGARKGGFELEEDPGTAPESNLCLQDFFCRFLVVDNIWIPLAESLLIKMFSPVWNHVIDGFGNHDPGKGRYKQQKSAWDSLHPGREWANRLEQGKLSKDQLLKKIKAHLEKPDDVRSHKS
jgi:hypothetical protein